MESLIDVQQATDVLGISEATLYRLIRDGGLPVVRLGARNLFRTEDIEAFVNARRVVRRRTVLASEKNVDLAHPAEEVNP
jgi:excisionase family DNA binding protein